MVSRRPRRDEGGLNAELISVVKVVWAMSVTASRIALLEGG